MTPTSSADSQAIWRARAARYVMIYLSLAAVLTVGRILTQDIRPTRNATFNYEAVKVGQRDVLEVEVQRLHNPERIRQWAFGQGMQRFAEAPKLSGEFGTIPEPVQLKPTVQLEMHTTWK